MSEMTTEKRSGERRQASHMKILQAMKNKGMSIRLMTSKTEGFDGVITQFDDQSITIRKEGKSYPITIFKHGIIGFTAADQESYDR